MTLALLILMMTVPASPGVTAAPTVYVPPSFPMKAPARPRGFPSAASCSHRAPIVNAGAEARIRYVVVKGNAAIVGMNVQGRGVVGDASFASPNSVVLFLQLDDQVPTITDGFTLNTPFNLSFPGLKPGPHQFLASLIDATAINDENFVPLYWSDCFTVL